MKIAFKIVEIINMIAIMFIMFYVYGIAITGLLQVISAIIFLILFPKNKLIYIYFGLVFIFFWFWDYGSFDWLFSIPLFLVGFLTFIIYNQKLKIKKTSKTQDYENA